MVMLKLIFVEISNILVVLILQTNYGPLLIKYKHILMKLSTYVQDQLGHYFEKQ